MAQERAAFHYFAFSPGRPRGILLRRRTKCGVKPIRTPFPHVAGDGVKTTAIRWKAVYRTRSCIAILCSIVCRKPTLPDVASMLAVGSELIAPRIQLLLEAASCRVLPLGFGRQICSRPSRV